MNRSAFDKFAYGFLFVLLDFKIMGFDILPEFIGYILFALGFKALISYSEYFRKGLYVTIPMIIVSIFSIYEKPAQSGGINFGTLGLLGIPIAIAILILGILVVYYLFQGIIEMAKNFGFESIAAEANDKWKQFLYLQFALLLGFLFVFIPLLGIAFKIAILILSIVLTYTIMKFMRLCGEKL